MKATVLNCIMLICRFSEGKYHILTIPVWSNEDYTVKETLLVSKITCVLPPLTGREGYSKNTFPDFLSVFHTIHRVSQFLILLWQDKAHRNQINLEHYLCLKHVLELIIFWFLSYCFVTWINHFSPLNY